MVAIKNIFVFAAAVSAAAIQRRSASTIMSDLTTIDKDTKSLTSSINSWDGSTFGALPIESAESTLEKAINACTADLKKETTFSESDSTKILSYISGTVVPDVATALKALDSKHSQVESDGLTSDVESALKDLKTDADNLFTALIAVTPSDQVANAKSAQSKIDADFTTAINTYAS